VNLQLWFGDGSSAYLPVMPPGTPELGVRFRRRLLAAAEEFPSHLAAARAPARRPVHGQRPYCVRQSIDNVNGKNAFSPDTPVRIQVYDDATCNRATYGTVFPDDHKPNQNLGPSRL
jgi:hypothetical protein